MLLDDAVIDRVLFDDRTRGKWRGEPLEAFVCARCEHLFVGVVDCHALLVDGLNPAKQVRYNVPQGTRCPRCGGNLQGQGQLTRDPTLEELRASAWGWVARNR